jgi:hypothetical protein
MTVEQKEHVKLLGIIPLRDDLMRLTLQALLVVASAFWGCAPETLPSKWADQIEAAARRLENGARVTLDLQPSPSCACLIVVVPTTGTVIDDLPEVYREVFREAELTAGSESTLVFASHDSLISSTLRTQAVQQLHVEASLRSVIRVTLVKAEGIAQIVGLE